MIYTADHPPPQKNFAWITGRFLLWTRAIWSLQNHGRTQIKRADLFNLRISFQRLSLPPSNNQAARSASKHIHPALCLSRCLPRGLFSLDTSGLIAFLARFPPGNAHLRLALRLLVRQPSGVAPRFPGAQGTRGPLTAPRWDSASPAAERPALERGPDGESSLQRRAATWRRLRTSSRGG